MTTSPVQFNHINVRIKMKRWHGPRRVENGEKGRAFKLFIIADGIDEALELHCLTLAVEVSKNQQRNFFSNQRANRKDTFKRII